MANKTMHHAVIGADTFELIDEAGREGTSQLKNALTTKAEQSGAYPDLTAGQMLSKNETSDSVPYNFRAVGQNATLEYTDAIVGGTVAWNQLVGSSPRSTYTLNDITVTNNNDGSFTLNGTASALTRLGLDSHTFGGNTAVGHKMLLYSDIKGATTNTYFFTIGYVGESAKDIGGGAVFNVPDTPYTGTPCVYVKEGTTINNVTIWPQIFDLTQMFGSTIADYIYTLEQANAGAGVAFFRKLFPNYYYPYDAGTLKSVEGVSSHDMVGFNQWDEEWEVNGASQIRSKNRIPVLSGLTYYAKTPSVGISLYFKAHINDTANISAVSVTNNTFTVPTNAHYAVIYANTGYGSVYNNDICINLSDPAKNGTYEPYVKRTYPLDSTKTFRGIFKLDSNNQLYADGDRYLPDGTVQRRYAVVDLGTLSWVYSESPNEGFYCDNIGAKIPQTTANNFVGICPIYAIRSYNDVFAKTYDKSIAVRTNGGVRIYDSAYTDATTFKTAMSGVYLVYELATPTTENAEPYQNPQIVDPDGTEEFVTTSIVPVGHESRYPDDLRAKLDALPWNLSMIAPIENGDNASQAYAVGKYFLHNNQFCKAKTAIAANAAFTLNTNYEVTTVADEIYSALH